MKTINRLLNSLNSKESKEFSKFLASPFFNQRKDVILLYDFYLKEKTFVYPQIDKPELFKNIYPNERFDDAKIRHLLSYLTTLIKTYYAHTNLESTPFNKQYQLLEKLKQKNLLKDFEKEWIKTEQLNIKQGYQNTTFHYHQHLLQLQKSEILVQQKRKGDTSMQKSIDELQIFYIASILKQSCSILTYQKMSTQNYNSLFLEDILETVSNNSQLKRIPSIAVYYYSLISLKEPQNEEHYDHLKKMIQDYNHFFTLPEIRDLYLIAINYCIQKLNKGKHKYIREAFEWYRTGLQEGVLLENGILSLFTYKNILNLGLNLKEFDWVEKYLLDYKTYLKEEDRENHYAYCQAVFYFNKPDYNRVLDLIQKVDFKNKLHQLDARRMMLRIYYEQKEINALESLLDSFQIYIRRQKDIGYHKEHYSNLIRFIRKLLKQNLNNKTIRKKLKAEVEQTDALAERIWLLQLLS